jgi:hypothetical protein
MVVSVQRHGMQPDALRTMRLHASYSASRPPLET